MHSPISLSSESGSLELVATELLTLTDSQLETLIQTCSQPERELINLALNRIEHDRAAGSLETFSSHVRTKDEHADGAESVKPFPGRTIKPYLWAFFDLVQENPVVLVEKSRQLMLTWAVCLYALWVAKFQQNRLIMIQSKKFEDAAALVYSKDPMLARISFMEANLPDWLKNARMSDCREGYMLFSTSSQIIAIPEGGDQIRSRSPSLVISDEFAFQPEAENSWKAIKPLVDNRGGRFIGISSACAGSYMQEMIAR